MAMNSRRRRFQRRRYSEIERERYRLLDETPPGPQDATSFSQIVPSVMKRMGLEEELWKQQIIEEWVELVGPQVARHARPGPVDRMTLVIFVNSSVWLNELSRYGQTKILEKVQARFGDRTVKRIRLQLDPDLGR